MKEYKMITAFCGAAPTISSVYHEPMRRTGEVLAEHGVTMVFGIGDNGLMGSMFQGVRNKNGSVVGVTTLKLLELQCKEPTVFKLGEIKIVPNLSHRKMDMFKMGEAILVGPGGWGTIDEFSEFAVLIQTGEVPKKPMIFLNYNHFWEPFRALMLSMLQEGTLNQDKVDYVDFVDHPDEVFDVLEKVQNRLDAKQH
ncbi:MAG: TIGR00730 family Rossman fold protein [Pseudomonadota bacterium]|nr:TIGR00730 family Rossman fold protein [Pseudomonadota bacterium]